MAAVTVIVVVVVVAHGQISDTTEVSTSNTVALIV